VEVVAVNVMTDPACPVWDSGCPPFGAPGSKAGADGGSPTVTDTGWLNNVPLASPTSNQKYVPSSATSPV